MTVDSVISVSWLADLSDASYHSSVSKADNVSVLSLSVTNLLTKGNK